MLPPPLVYGQSTRHGPCVSNLNTELSRVVQISIARCQSNTIASMKYLEGLIHFLNFLFIILATFIYYDPTLSNVWQKQKFVSSRTLTFKLKLHIYKDVIVFLVRSYMIIWRWVYYYFKGRALILSVCDDLPINPHLYPIKASIMLRSLGILCISTLLIRYGLFRAALYLSR